MLCPAASSPASLRSRCIDGTGAGGCIDERGGGGALMGRGSALMERGSALMERGGGGVH